MDMKLCKPGCVQSLVIAMCLSVFVITTAARQSSGTGRKIAVTIDDLPLNGPSIELKRLKAMTSKLLNSLKKFRVPTVGFVNESLLYSAGETDERIQLLREWRDAGVELGNHTF